MGAVVMKSELRDRLGELWHRRPHMPMTRHASWRAAQRGVPSWVIELAIRRGRSTYVDGAIVFYLGWRELESLVLAAAEKERSEGTTVRVGHDGSIITVYRNRKGLRCRVRRRGHLCRPLRGLR